MLSKQRIKGLFNREYNKDTDRKKAAIDKMSTPAAIVKMFSVRTKKNDKYLKVSLPKNNPVGKTYIKLNLNTVARPNYKDGSVEMYRSVNGLCLNCGNSHSTGEIKFSEKGYILKNIYCDQCDSLHPWDFVHTYSNKKQVNRGKVYSDKKKKNNKTSKSKIYIKKKNFNDKLNQL